MFIFNANTTITASDAILTKPVANAVHILKRDMKKVFGETGSADNQIILEKAAISDEPVINQNQVSFTKTALAPEAFLIDIADHITITAGDDLGFVYGLLYLSEHYLDIKPFWFWMDQQIPKKEPVAIEPCHYESPKPAVRYRGWFFNDEVLLMRWSINGDEWEPWRMAYETLLRCGGNMTIPGTDKNARRNRQLASDYGLWITHHHAEPLGAEMFVRRYPDLDPNFSEYSDLFFKLWEEAVIEQKDMKVIWNVGFRGQGDCPFWSMDSSGNYNTPEKQGELISKLMEKQTRIIEKYVENPVLCTNLYGEIMELYKDGHIHFDDNIIRIYADNGYGKMVTRRRDNHSVRVAALPSEEEAGDQIHHHNGIYYHVSFYDLQAANHITMLPNSVDFVNHELSEVMRRHADDYWIINCSNVRPHVYYLDAVRKKWFGREISDAAHSREFVKDYFEGTESIAENLLQRPSVMLSYGPNEDEHAGEQFYNENIRMIMTHLIRRRTDNISGLYWIVGDIPLQEQIKKLCDICRNGMDGLENYQKECEEISASLSGENKTLFDGTILLQAKLHSLCAKGMLLCETACDAYFAEEYKKAFLHFGYSAECYQAAADALRACEYGVWKGFYYNDCFADIKHTAYMVYKMMGVVREIGDNARHDKWYRDAVYSDSDRKVMTLLVNDNHMTDLELFQAFKAIEDCQPS